MKSGLGWYLKWQQGYVEYAKVYAALIIMAAFFSEDLLYLWTRNQQLASSTALIASPLVTVARITFAPPSFSSSAAGSWSWLSM